MSFHSPILALFHPGALGDGLLALAAVRALRKNFSGHSLIWFGHKELGEILVAASEVAQSYPFDAFNFLEYAGEHSVRKEIYSALFAHCDRAVGWMRDAEGLWKKFFTAIGVKQYILQSPHDPGLGQYHMADRYIETLQSWFPIQQMLNQIPESLLLYATPEAGKESYASNYQLIILHPGSGSPFKCAPPVLWAELITRLQGRSHRETCLVGGPADTDIVQRVQELLTEVRPTIFAGLDLLSVARKLQQAQLYIGNDSGLSHLAAHLKIPSILLFGATDPAMWAPRGKHIKVVGNYDPCRGKKNFSPLSTDEIFKKAEEILDGISRSKLQTAVGNDFHRKPCLG